MADSDNGYPPERDVKVRFEREVSNKLAVPDCRAKNNGAS